MHAWSAAYVRDHPVVDGKERGSAHGTSAYARRVVAHRAAYGRMRASHTGVYAARRSAWHMCVCAHPAGVTLQQPEAR